MVTGKWASLDASGDTGGGAPPLPPKPATPAPVPAALKAAAVSFPSWVDLLEYLGGDRTRLDQALNLMKQRLPDAADGITMLQNTVDQVCDSLVLSALKQNLAAEVVGLWTTHKSMATDTPSMHG